MSHIIKPSDIEAAALDIIEYYEKSNASHDDKIKILTMLQEHYEGTNYSVVDQWFANLIKRSIDKHEPQTGFEKP
jgi:hypothetical protein